jgi:hypothetical protein
METSYPDVGKDIALRRQISDETRPRLEDAIKAFNATWSG